MSNIAAYLAAAVLLGFAAYRRVADRRISPYPSQSAAYGFVICLAAAMALLAPATTDALTGVGVPAVDIVLAGYGARTAAVGFLMSVAASLWPGPHGAADAPDTPDTARGTRRVGREAPRSPRRAPWRAPVLPAALLVQGAMFVTFLAARPRMTADGSLRVTPGAGRWLLSAHDAVFGGYAIWGLAVIAAVLRREARRAGPGPLRLGLRLTLAAALVAVGWAAWTADDIVNVLRTEVQDGSEDMVSNVLGAVCATLVVAGTTVWKWGAAMALPWRGLRASRTHARLAPLWKALHRELPQIALDGRRGGLSLLLPANIEFALYRRIIEIHDGRLALRPYTPAPESMAESIRRHGGPAAPDAALREAASLAVALANLRAGRKTGDAASAGGSAGESLDLDAPATVTGEGAWLVRVTEAFTGSPVVRAVLADLAAADRPVGGSCEDRGMDESNRALPRLLEDEGRAR